MPQNTQQVRMRAETYAILSNSLSYDVSAIPAPFKNTFEQGNLEIEVGSFVYHECEDNCLTLYHSFLIKVKPSKVKPRHLQCKVGKEVHLNKLFYKLWSLCFSSISLFKAEHRLPSNQANGIFCLNYLVQKLKEIRSNIKSRRSEFFVSKYLLTYMYNTHLCTCACAHTHAPSSFPKSCD